MYAGSYNRKQYFLRFFRIGKVFNAMKKEVIGYDSACKVNLPGRFW